MEWHISGDRPIYTQLVEQIKRFIISGSLPPGSKLPSVRDMAQDAAVNPNTMQKALSLLDDEGLLFPHSTTGRTITRDLALIERMRSDLAGDKARALIRELRAMGFTPEGILATVAEHVHPTHADPADRSDL